MRRSAALHRDEHIDMNEFDHLPLVHFADNRIQSVRYLCLLSTPAHPLEHLMTHGKTPSRCVPKFTPQLGHSNPLIIHHQL